MTGKRQITPSLVDVASSGERLSKLPVTGDRAKPVSSRLAHARTAAIASAHAAADASYEPSVRRAYVTLGLEYVARIATLPFPASVKKAAGAQRLSWSIKATRTEIVMRSDDRCTAGFKSPSCGPGWGLPLHKAFTRAITPDKPSTADITTLIGDCFRQVSRDVEEGAVSRALPGGDDLSTIMQRALWITPNRHGYVVSLAKVVSPVSSGYSIVSGVAEDQYGLINLFPLSDKSRSWAAFGKAPII